MYIECLKSSTSETVIIRAFTELNTFGEACFCGLARCILSANKYGDSIFFIVKDNDDTNFTVEYLSGSKEMPNVYHELLNYLNDTDRAWLNTNLLFNRDEHGIPRFFPEIKGITRRLV